MARRNKRCPLLQSPTLVTDEHHVEQVQPVIESMRSISCMTIAIEKFVESGIHLCSMMTQEPQVFFLSPPMYHEGEMKAMHSFIAF